MKKFLFRLGLLPCLMLVLQGCPYGSEVAIDEPAVKIDEKLLGKWEAKNSTEYTYTITKKDDFSYKFEKTGKSSPEATLYTAFISVVDGVRFLNVSEDASTTKTFYLYKLEMSGSGAKATLHPVTENITEKFATSGELKDFIKKHMGLSFFYSKDKEEYFRAD